MHIFGLIRHGTKGTGRAWDGVAAAPVQAAGAASRRARPPHETPAPAAKEGNAGDSRRRSPAAA
eukprot:gene672-2384_t